ncbi:NUDIX hydrolase [Cytobacillus spongiae]|uniref:NUDIX hydrolase n=1 Tax=Cytobacillus spongiae TaxID=2901381 RepID=UPI001F36D13D|nr:NUDIX hydrolase [Cytobacillus spongiae]UII56148.1 NUDIX hydrolase [Cytobacillus spongiae]
MDLVFVKGNQCFNYRAAAVCIEEGHILLNRGKEEDYWFLPGGRVQMMESGAEALRRELKEEIGAVLHVESLLWIVENFFILDKHQFHEIGLYYKGALQGSSFIEKGGTPFVIQDQQKEFLFQWIPIEQVKHLNIQPTFLQNRLEQLPKYTEHLILRQ